jgi:hypothetical protein
MLSNNKNYQAISLISKETENINFVAILQSYLYERDNCFYCGATLTEENRTIDHVVTRSRLRNSVGQNFNRHFGNVNLVHSCKKCNQLKSNKSLCEFMQIVLILHIKEYKTIISNIQNVLILSIIRKIQCFLLQFNVFLYIFCLFFHYEIKL